MGDNSDSFTPPNRAQRILGWVVCQAFRFACLFVRPSWILEKKINTIQHRLALWALGGAYFYAERAAGRI